MTEERVQVQVVERIGVLWKDRYWEATDGVFEMSRSVAEGYARNGSLTIVETAVPPPPAGPSPDRIPPVATQGQSPDSPESHGTGPRQHTDPADSPPPGPAPPPADQTRGSTSKTRRRTPTGLRPRTGPAAPPPSAGPDPSPVQRHRSGHRLEHRSGDQQAGRTDRRAWRGLGWGMRQEHRRKPSLWM